MYRRRTPTLLAGSLLAGTALLGACASTGGIADPTTRAATSGTSTTGTRAPTTDAPGAGWIGGEPDWDMAAESGGYAPDMAVPEMSVDKASGTVAASGASETADTTASAGDAPVAGGVVAPNDDPLRAGSVDDNVDFTAFLDYLGRIRGLGVQTREFDPTGRIIVTVTGTSGLPVAGAEVAVSAAGLPVATVRTTADGTARFLPMLYGGAAAQSYDFAVGGSSGSAAPGAVVALMADAVGGAQAPVAVDVLFLLDATGSMGGRDRSAEDHHRRSGGADRRPRRAALCALRDDAVPGSG